MCVATVRKLDRARLLARAPTHNLSQSYCAVRFTPLGRNTVFVCLCVCVTTIMQEAIAALNSLQTPAKELAEQKRTGARDLVKSVPQMEGYAERVGITAEQLNALDAVHVAGTKGKGSTCAMVEAILRGRRLKTGLYAPPLGQLFPRPETIFDTQSFWEPSSALRPTSTHAQQCS
jgi:hypothetical protein